MIPENLMAVALKEMLRSLSLEAENGPIDEIVLTYIGPFGPESITLSRRGSFYFDETAFKFLFDTCEVIVKYYTVQLAFARKNKAEVLHLLNFKARKDDSLEQAIGELNKTVEKYGITREEVPNPAKQFLRGAVFCIKCRKASCECPKISGVAVVSVTLANCQDDEQGEFPKISGAAMTSITLDSGDEPA